MNDRFQRTALLLGQENLDKLKNRRVAVFGVGGVGGHAVEALCRCGIGMIDIFDGDVIDVTNINRQLIATQKTIGRNKVDVMKERLLDINPDVVVAANRLFYLPETADDVDLSVYDYIADAVDTMTAKLELVSRATALNVPVISSMGAANKLDPTAFEVSDIFETSVCPMARIMRNELRKRGVGSLKVVYSKETPVKIDKTCWGRGTVHLPHQYQTIDQDKATSGADEPSPCPTLPSNDRPLPSSVSFVPPVVGLILAGEIIKDLIK